MKFILTKTDDSYNEPVHYIEITDLEHLMNFIKERGHNVIIMEAGGLYEFPVIEIYNDYRE